ncbi:unnamed protein product, partial [marine sediment metagenome]
MSLIKTVVSKFGDQIKNLFCLFFGVPLVYG